MCKEINTNQLRDMFLFAAQRIVDSEEMLTEIDLKIGDGDHGTGMALGFRNVLKELNGQTYPMTDDVFRALGNTLLDTMGGASGVLFGTVFISGLVHHTPTPTLDLRGFSTIFAASLEALKKRGKAKVGDKTMVDALEPAVLALGEGADQGLGLKEGFAYSAQKAKEGMNNSKNYLARFGRAKSYGEAALGLQDAGATSVWILFEAMADWINNHLI